MEGTAWSLDEIPRFISTVSLLLKYYLCLTQWQQLMLFSICWRHHSAWIYWSKMMSCRIRRFKHYDGSSSSTEQSLHLEWWTWWLIKSASFFCATTYFQLLSSMHYICIALARLSIWFLQFNICNSRIARTIWVKTVSFFIVICRTGLKYLGL